MNERFNQPRIQPVDPEQTSGQAREILEGNRAKFGTHLNFFTTLANAPAVLDGYTGLSAALAGGELSPRIREEIAVSVSGWNECDYCGTAHGHAALANGVAVDDLPALAEGHVNEEHEQAAVDFALRVLETSGRVSDQDLAAVRDAGYSDAEVLEMIAHVAMTFFSNALNNVSDPVVDLPPLPQPQLQQAA